MTTLAVLLAVLLATWLAVSHNRFVRQRNLVEEAWRQIDVELRRRHDLVPGLVQAVQAHAAHEQRALEQVLAARSAALGAGSVADRAGAEVALTGELHGLLAVAEGYPQLQAAGPFQQLQEQLAETEDRLAAARRFYNGNVRALNTRVEAFPSALVARSFGFETAEWFELEPLERAELEEAPELED